MEIPLMTGGIAHTTADLTAGNKNQKKVAINVKVNKVRI